MRSPFIIALSSVLISVLILLSGCGDNNSPTPDIDNPVSTPKEIPADIETDTTQKEITQTEITQTDSSQVTVTPALTPPTPEQRYQQFIAADEYSQQEMINNMENTGDDVALMANLITQNISSDAKQAMLQTLMYGEYDEVAAVIRLALRDSDPDVVIAAIDGLRTLDSPMDIPVLQTLAAETANEDVRDAANSAIDYLTP